jgi:hypothetical protein
MKGKGPEIMGTAARTKCRGDRPELLSGETQRGGKQVAIAREVHSEEIVPPESAVRYINENSSHNLTQANM